MSLEAVVFRRMDPKLKLAILVIGFLVLIAFPIANSYFFAGRLTWSRFAPPR